MTVYQEGVLERFCSVLLLLSVFAAIVSIVHWFDFVLGGFSPERALKTCFYLTLMLGLAKVTSPGLRKKLTWSDLFKYGILLVIALFAQGTYQTMQSNLVLGAFFQLLGFLTALGVVWGGVWFCLKLSHK